MKILLKIVPLILDWLYTKIAPIVIEFFRRMKESEELKERHQKRLAQADLVERLRLEILALRSEGKPVPYELEKRLHDEAIKLINM